MARGSAFGHKKTVLQHRSVHIFRRNTKIKYIFFTLHKFYFFVQLVKLVLLNTKNISLIDVVKKKEEIFYMKRKKKLHECPNAFPYMHKSTSSLEMMRNFWMKCIQFCVKSHFLHNSKPIPRNRSFLVGLMWMRLLIYKFAYFSSSSSRSSPNTPSPWIEQ